MGWLSNRHEIGCSIPMVIIVFHYGTDRFAQRGFDEYQGRTIIFHSVPIRNRQSRLVCHLGTEVLFFQVARGAFEPAIASIHVLLADRLELGQTPLDESSNMQ